MAKPMEVKGTNLIRKVEERTLAKKIEEEKRNQEKNIMPHLPEDCVSCILVRLPIRALQRSRFVCKPWYDIINTLKFIDDHLCRSETVFIFTSPNEKAGYDNEMVSIFPEDPKSFSVEAKLHQSSSGIIVEKPLVRRASKFYIKYLEVSDGRGEVREFDISCLGQIRAACNGDNQVKKGGIVVMNPVTRKLMPLPIGTLAPSHDESYGFSISNTTGEYKVVHLFRDCLGYVSCELLNIGGRSWREVDGPSFGLLSWFGYDPVSAIGALHWTPHIDHSDYIVSMEMDKEKFHQIPLPKSSRDNDRIIELNGFLSFVTHESFNQIDVWILKGLFGNVWTKHHSITRGCILDLAASFSLRIKGDIVFNRSEDGSIYLYNFQLQKMTKVEMEKKSVCRAAFFPHVNSLVSW